MSAASYEPVIGLEVHVQLATDTKLFCADRAEFGAEPNTHVCPVCLGLPGALPVVDRGAVALAMRAAVALNCGIHDQSVFARKNYFYPDLPKGYQITQYDRPLATAGWLESASDGRRVRIRRIHLEEDAGKLVHDRIPGRTAIDLNRAGVPLIEIVTEPDLRSARAARAFLRRLKRTLAYLEVSDCDMEKGSLRVDANVSVRRAGSDTLGERTEIKNMNSFGNVERAIDAEIRRQRATLEAGGTPGVGTRYWDARTGTVRDLRGKETVHDYRYFPEPDLPPLTIERGEIDRIRAALPELPAARRARFRDDFELPEYDVAVLTASRALADYFEATARAAGDAKAASNWVMTDVLAWTNEHGRPVEEFPVAPDRLAELITLVADGTVSSSGARTVFTRMTETDAAPRDIVEREGLAQVDDAAQLEAWIEEAFDTHPDAAVRLRNGELRLIGYFMGRVMDASDGAANPQAAREALERRAAERG